MAPIKNYFSEERMERSRAKNAEAIGRINENNRKRMLDAIASYEGNKRKLKLVMTDEVRLMILNLYLEGHKMPIIAKMVGTGEREVFEVLQMPLLRYICGARHIGVFYNEPTHRVLPKEDVILNELADLDIDHKKFSDEIMEKTGCSRRVANRLMKDNGCGIPLRVAAGVCDYFGMCPDQLFVLMPKEKAAE